MDRRKDELIVFNKLAAVSGGTGESLEYLLTQKIKHVNDKDGVCTLLHLYQRSGYKIVLIAATTRFGRWESLEHILFSTIKHKIYLQDIHKYYNDHDILPILEKALAAYKDEQVLFVIHTNGSHVPLSCRYPEEFTPFLNKVEHVTGGLSKKAQEMINTYDNSIAWTDLFLEKTLQILEKADREAFMFYISDHGETPRSAEWRTATDKDLYEVPFVLWLSEKYKAENPGIMKNISINRNARMNVSQLYWGLLTLGGITYDNFPKELDIFSPEFKEPAE
jgi:glucan phosphoethanolaminetransferase (alkaline phosphatase superfamily)